MIIHSVRRKEMFGGILELFEKDKYTKLSNGSDSNIRIPNINKLMTTDRVNV